MKNETTKLFCFQMYLSAGSLAVEIVSAKSSEMNVVIPSGDDFVSFIMLGTLIILPNCTVSYVCLFRIFLKDLFFCVSVFLISVVLNIERSLPSLCLFVCIFCECCHSVGRRLCKFYYFVEDPSNSGKLHGFSESTYISLFLVFLKDLFFMSICLYVCTSYMFVIASGFLFYRP